MKLPPPPHEKQPTGGGDGDADVHLGDLAAADARELSDVGSGETLIDASHLVDQRAVHRGNLLDPGLKTIKALVHLIEALVYSRLEAVKTLINPIETLVHPVEALTDLAEHLAQPVTHRVHLAHAPDHTPHGPRSGCNLDSTDASRLAIHESEGSMRTASGLRA